jgi:acyl carrier protein
MKEKEALAWIAEVFEESPERIKADTLRKAIVGWDSLGTLVLIAALDERADIHLTEKDINGMQSVGDILEILRRNGKLDGE